MLHRAPKLTARTFYAPLLRITRNRATNRKQCAGTEVNHISILYRKPVLRTYIVSARDRRLNPSVRPTRSGSLRPQSIQSKSERRSLSTFLKKLFQEKENFLRKPQKKIRPNPLTCRTDSAIIIKLNLFSQNNMLIWLSW